MTVLERMQKFVDDCLDGTFITCEHVKDACRRHNKDMLREDIYFDEEAASKVLKFCELMIHVKGSSSGQRIKLEPWQVFFAGSIFGWKRTKTQLRRFLEGVLHVPRKNGKTTFEITLDLYMLVGDGEAGAEVILAAAKEAQAKDLFGIATQMVNKNQDFKDYYGITCTTECIYQKDKGSKFTFVIGKPADGGNPSCAIVEEYHEHKGSSAYDVLKNGMGSREQPLMFIMSTAGHDTRSAYAMHLEYCRSIVQGIVDDDTVFCLEFTVDKDDDWKEESSWQKANPNYGVSVRAEYLEAQRKKAMAKVSSRSDILTKHLNIWNNESEGWIDILKWKSCGNATMQAEDFAGQDCWLGVDLASRVDLCSVMYVFHKDGKYCVFGKHYINAERARLPENAHFDTWEKEGWLTVTEGAQTDFRIIEEDIKKSSKMFNIRELGYDPREATLLMQDIREWAGFDCVEILQGAANFSEPMKILEGAYISGNLVHNNDPVLTWAASNVELKRKDTKTFYPAKKGGNPNHKIDPMVALIMALSRSEIAKPSAPDLYIGVF